MEIHKSLIKNHKSQTLKKFVNDFNFPSPTWENLPVGFPQCDTSELTLQERHLFEAIKTVWFLSRPINYHLIKVVYTGTTLLSFVILFMEIVSITYYLNIEYRLGLTFLTEIFA